MSFRIGTYRPICVVQQEMNYIIKRLPDSIEKEQLLARVQEAHSMAKSMDAKLKEYNRSYNSRMWTKKFEPIDMKEIKPHEK